ncbi:MAG: SIMPL domain-containing protein [Crocinitomicaceae bacterium]|nr:SIMPL domain-containing protein [Crocinitomicaceae bacterium]
MKNLLIFSVLISSICFGQESGNINYQSDRSNRSSGNLNYINAQIYNPTQGLSIPFSNTNDLYIEVNGLSNIKADSYVAVFHVTQMGKTALEVNALLNEKLDHIKAAITEKSTEVEVFVDMLSFVPVYEYTVEKKLFSKDTYNEIPKGFELKKNIHIHYTDSELLSDFISICTTEEVYDLIKVDYNCNDLEQKKKELAEKAVAKVKEKAERFEGLLNVDFEALDKQVVEGFQVYYPVEQYQSYKAFSSASLDLNKTGNVTQTAKTRTSFYQPIPAKAYDFVINPVILAPVIQIVYQVRLKIVNPPKPKEIVAATKADKEYFLVTTNGDIKELQIGN